MADVDFVVLHAASDLRHGKWLVDQLDDAGFSARAALLDDPFPPIVSIGRLAVLSRGAVPVLHSPMPRLRRDRRMLGIAIEDVQVSLDWPVKADVAISALDHRAAFTVLQAIKKHYGADMSFADKVLCDVAIKKLGIKAGDQRRAFLSYRHDDRDSVHVSRAVRRHLGSNRVFWD
jgi:hypothetical protein